jgi:hypothetical protein
VFVSNFTTGGTIQAAVEIGHYQLRRPAAGAETEPEGTAQCRFGYSEVTFNLIQNLPYISRRPLAARESLSRGANFFRNDRD